MTIKDAQITIQALAEKLTISACSLDAILTYLLVDLKFQNAQAIRNNVTQAGCTIGVSYRDHG